MNTVCFLRFSPRRIILAGMVAITVLLAGCATPSRIALPESTRAELGTTESVAITRQQEIRAEIVRSNMTAAAGGGLLWALVDAGINNSRAKTAEKNVADIRNALVSVDLGKDLASVLNAEAAKAAWFPDPTIEARQILTNEKADKLVAETTADNLLIIDVAYSMSADFSEIKVNAIVALCPKDLKKHPKAARPAFPGMPKSIYFNDFTVTRVGGAYGNSNRDSNSETWVSDDGKVIRNAVSSAINELAQMIITDIADSYAPADNKLYKTPVDGTSRDMVLSQNGYVFNVKAYIYKTMNDRLWLRLNSGSLYSIEK